MRTVLLILLVLVASTCSAQNWALLNPAYKYNYSNDGTDTISNQIFVTHIDTLGPDSFRYELNRIGVVCDTCISLPTDCTGPFGTIMLAGQGQYLDAGSMVIGPSTWSLGEDTLVLLPTSTVGTSWNANPVITATVTSVSLSTVLGEVDSLKTITLSNGAEVVLSREHGLVIVPRHLSTPLDTLTLVGVEGVGLGVHFPTIDDLFDYQPGDVLQYLSASSGSTGIGLGIWHCSGTEKLTIIQRGDSAGHPVYWMRRVSYSSCWSPGSGWDEYSGIDTVYFNPHTCYADLLVQGFSDLWPGSIAPGGSDCNQSYPWNLYWQASLNSEQHYVLSTLGYDSYEKTLLVCTPDSSAFKIDYGGVYFDAFEYEQEVGLKQYRMFFFEFGRSRILSGWVIEGVQQGSIASDVSIMLGIDEQAQTHPLSFSPNPASDEITLSGVQPGCDVIIHDLEGRLVRTARITSTTEMIDVRDLQAGVYLLRIDGLRPQRFIIAR